MYKESIERGHPCFDKLAHFRVGRIHVPVAPKCNIKCNYCQRKLSPAENRPGVSSSIINPDQALERIRKAAKKDPAIKIVGIAGPGDSLANEETFITLGLVNRYLPQMKKCISTNGLLLPDKIMDLVAVGLDSISITVNAVDPLIGSKFYSRVRYMGKTNDDSGFDQLAQNQLKGIALAEAAGISVKVNSVLVPDLNAAHLYEVAQTVKEAGAKIMNIMPLKPLGKMKDWRAPTCFELEEARFECEKVIEQFRLCRQCRADAVGIPGKAEPISKMPDLTPVYHY